MLLKYLNELDTAVADAKNHPDSAHVERCVACAAVLEDYLQGQMEPVRLKGEELMRKLWPQEISHLVAANGQQFASVRH